MMKQLAGAAAIGTILVGPFALIAAFSGDGDTGTATVAAQLDLSQVPAAYQPWIVKAAKTCPSVAGPLLPAQIDQESGWNPDAKSGAGALGLAQFMPGTWAAKGVDADGGGAVITDGPDAIMTMARYDCQLAHHAQALINEGQATGDVVSLMLASYNAGPDAVTKYRGVPPYPETEQYVSNILAGMATYTSAPGSSTEQSAFGARVVAAAEAYKGLPYSWGGGGPDGPTYGIGEGANTKGFDCSGLVLFAIYQASGGKIVLPHSSEKQATMGQAVDPSAMQVGDVIAFQLGQPGDYDHIGIYAGDGHFLEAPKTGEVIRVSDLSDPYYAKRTITVRRFG